MFISSWRYVVMGITHIYSPVSQCHLLSFCVNSCKERRCSGLFCTIIFWRLQKFGNTWYKVNGRVMLGVSARGRSSWLARTGGGLGGGVGDVTALCAVSGGEFPLLGLFSGVSVPGCSQSRAPPETPRLNPTKCSSSGTSSPVRKLSIAVSPLPLLSPRRYFLSLPLLGCFYFKWSPVSRRSLRPIALA